MRRAVLILALGGFACGGEAPPSEAITTTVVRTLNFERESPSGVSRGFDLDGFVSESNDGRSCFQADFESPDGEPGIDNQLATLLPLIDLAGEGALQSLVQNAIDEGRLLMFFEVFEPEPGQYTLRVRRGDDVPLLGTDGAILSGQTLALHETEPLLGEVEATMQDGMLEAGPFALKVPVIVFSQLYEVEMPSARVRLEYDDETGDITLGTVGGGLPIPQLVQILETAGNFGPEFEELFGDAVREAGDLARDANGDCTEMSAALTFDAVPAFVWE